MVEFKIQSVDWNIYVIAKTALTNRSLSPPLSVDLENPQIPKHLIGRLDARLTLRVSVDSLVTVSVDSHPAARLREGSAYHCRCARRFLIRPLRARK